MKSKIISQVTTEQNPFYDENKSNNGGGYHQPKTVTNIKYKNELYEFVYNSTSCGDFGRRYSKTLYKNNQELASIYLNEVDKPDIYESSFTWNNLLHVELYKHGLISKHDLTNI